MKILATSSQNNLRLLAPAQPQVLKRPRSHKPLNSKGGRTSSDELPRTSGRTPSQSVSAAAPDFLRSTMAQSGSNWTRAKPLANQPHSFSCPRQQSPDARALDRILNFSGHATLLDPTFSRSILTTWFGSSIPRPCAPRGDASEFRSRSYPDIRSEKSKLHEAGRREMHYCLFSLLSVELRLELYRLCLSSKATGPEASKDPKTLPMGKHSSKLSKPRGF